MSRKTTPATTSLRTTVRKLGRAAGGAIVFTLPMLMTMEMWQIGEYLPRSRLLVLFLCSLPLLVALCRQIGFERTRFMLDDVLDGLISLLIGGLVSFVCLRLFGVITAQTSLEEVIGKIVVQIVPASMGAALASSQFSAKDDDEERHEKPETYGGELFLMSVGALFLGFNVAPTQEILQISFQMDHLQTISLMLLSIALMHGFVFALEFAGSPQITPGEPWWSGFVRLTLPGYVIALAVSLFLLWVFARTDSLALDGIVTASIVLGFPSAIGAAAARLIL